VPDPFDKQIEILDFTEDQKNPPVVRKHEIVHGKVVERDPKAVTGIVVHQSACIFGPKSNPEARHRRALNVACHALAFTDGVVALPNPLPWYVWHANKLNACSLGLEIEGHYPGLQDDPSTLPREDIKTTWGGSPTPLTDLTVTCACAALKALVTEGEAQGMPLEWIWAHRQASATRRSDPGMEIWKRVVLGYAVPVLGLKTNPAFVVGAGMPIPIAWEVAGEGPY
jgi:hypothetical protein